MTTAAVRPQGVIIHRQSGTLVRCELTYRGLDDGLHIWEALTAPQPGDKVTIDLMPPYTAVTFPAPDEETP